MTTNTDIAVLAPGVEGPLRILLVEDDPNDQVLFCTIARRKLLPARIDCVADGQQALEVLLAKDATLPDLMVLDLQLPVVDGFEVLSCCRSSARLRDLPVLVLSGSLDERWAKRALALGASRFFAKPSRLSDWAALMREIEGFAKTRGLGQQREVVAELAGSGGANRATRIEESRWKVA